MFKMQNDYILYLIRTVPRDSAVKSRLDGFKAASGNMERVACFETIWPASKPSDGFKPSWFHFGYILPY